MLLAYALKQQHLMLRLKTALTQAGYNICERLITSVCGRRKLLAG